MTKIVNLIGAPSSGKTTTRSYLMNRLRIEHPEIKTEEVTEYAKELVYENPELLNDQFFVTAEQHRRIKRYDNKVDLVLVDSPIILGAIYNKTLPQDSWRHFVMDLFDSYNNINFFLPPLKLVNNYGRVHNSAESIEIQEQIEKLLAFYSIPYFDHISNSETYNKLMEIIHV
jgi:nicotinamide riboside kinase